MPQLTNTMNDTNKRINTHLQNRQMSKNWQKLLHQKQLLKKCTQKITHSRNESDPIGFKKKLLEVVTAIGEVFKIENSMIKLEKVSKTAKLKTTSNN